MLMPTPQQANERRIVGLLQSYFEGQPKCTVKWIRNVIGSDAALANRLLLTRFKQFGHLPRYRELQSTPVFPTHVIICSGCDISYEIRYRFRLGTNWGLHLFQCVECGKNYPIPGEKVNARRLNEATGHWETIG